MSVGHETEGGRFEPWEVLSTREIYSAMPWFAVTVQTVKLPDGRIVDDYHQISFADYVVVFAQRADGAVLVERMYKHGIGQATLALPSGLIDDGEDPLSSAKRELREETGHTSDDWRALGSFVVNGNYSGAKAHFFGARNARKEAEPDPGDLEEMDVVPMSVEEVVTAIRDGEMVLIGSIVAIALATHPLLQVG